MKVFHPFDVKVVVVVAVLVTRKRMMMRERESIVKVHKQVKDAEKGEKREADLFFPFLTFVKIQYPHPQFRSSY